MAYYTVDKVSEMIGMHPKTIRKYINEGKLKANKVGKQWRITGHDLSVFTEGEVKEKENDVEFETSSTETSDKKVKVSTVIDIDVNNKDEAMRISNTLLAVMNTKDPKLGHATLNVQFIEKDNKVRLMLWGSIAFTEVMLDCVTMLTD